MHDLFERARTHDRAAVEELDRMVRDLSRAVCRGGGPGASPDLDWEDVAQEVYRRLHAVGFESYRRRGSERSYVYSMVKATAIQMARSFRRRRKREDHAAESPTVEAPDATSRLSVRSILEALDEGCRDLIERLFLRDQTYAEAAGELGLAESSVRAKLSRCLRRARQIVERGGPR
jgi:RNA polymerase sigma factor (sigma-70 family)